MNAEIIAVGTELLLGQIANTNGQYLSQQLAQHGINVYKHTVVGDNITRIRSVVRESKKSSDIIIITGGLGPTEDDVTRNALAKEYDTALILDDQALAQVEAFFAARGQTASEANRRQALCLEGSHVFQNHAGLACGMVYMHEDTLFILLPGPPHELKTMFAKEVSPYLLANDQDESFLLSRTLRFYGIGESALEASIHDLIMQQTNPTIAPLAGQDEVTLRLTVRETDQTSAKTKLDQLEMSLLERCGEFLYGYDEDTLFSQVLNDLHARGWKLATAESLTGGLLGALLTEVPGSSSVYNGGAVTYSKETKEKQLGVNVTTLEHEGAVSVACAKEMAEGAKSRFQADVGIALTGVAGPETQEDHPAGTLFIAIACPNDTRVIRRKLAGDRLTIRRRAAKEACASLLKDRKGGR